MPVSRSDDWFLMGEIPRQFQDFSLISIILCLKLSKYSNEFFENTGCHFKVTFCAGCQKLGLVPNDEKRFCNRASIFGMIRDFVVVEW